VIQSRRNAGFFIAPGFITIGFIALGFITLATPPHTTKV
jgi:hypothetical protein